MADCSSMRRRFRANDNSEQGHMSEADPVQMFRGALIGPIW